MKRALAIVGFLLFPLIASGHEVYVLSSTTVAQSLTMPPLRLFDVIMGNMGQFFFWAFISLWAIFTVFTISLFKPLEQKLHRFFNSLRPHAVVVARITLGIAIAASGYFAAFLGPELAFSAVLPSWLEALARLGFIGAGIAIAIGFRAREISLALAVVYAALWIHWGVYMLTYANYFGEMLLIASIGSAFMWLERYGFLIMRMGFGISLIFSSVYAKLIHAELALQVVHEYTLTQYFPFSPEFIVLGALSIEILLGLFFILGIEIRFASLFLLFWLTLSLLYFGESAWPHIIIAGSAIAIFMRGYDRHTLQLSLMRRWRKSAAEPVL